MNGHLRNIGADLGIIDVDASIDYVIRRIRADEHNGNPFCPDTLNNRFQPAAVHGKTENVFAAHSRKIFQLFHLFVRAHFATGN